MTHANIHFVILCDYLGRAPDLFVFVSAFDIPIEKKTHAAKAMGITGIGVYAISLVMKAGMPWATCLSMISGTLVLHKHCITR